MKDFHCHLYGCLTPKIVYSLLKQNSSKVLGGAKSPTPWLPAKTRWSWYADEFSRQFTIDPPLSLDEIEQSRFSEEKIARCFLHSDEGSFADFQARFNFLIALFPLANWQTTILESCFLQQVKEGVSHREYRVFLDLTQNGWEQVFRVAQNLNQDHLGEHSCSLVVSMPHEKERYLNTFSQLDAFFCSEPGLLKVFAGIDFCMFEERYEPSDKSEMLASTRTFSIHSRPIPLLMHVGETMETIGLFDSLKRLESTLALDATRLGHACSLVRELETEAEAKLQAELTEKIIDQNILIETCPTSNARIARMKKPCAVDFQKKGIPYLVCSDDPGVLSTSLQQELGIVESSLKGGQAIQASYPEKFPFD
jgi:adenosine deaminase